MESFLGTGGSKNCHQRSEFTCERYVSWIQKINFMILITSVRESAIMGQNNVRVGWFLLALYTRQVQDSSFNVLRIWY